MNWRNESFNNDFSKVRLLYKTTIEKQRLSNISSVFWREKERFSTVKIRTQKIMERIIKRLWRCIKEVSKNIQRFEERSEIYLFKILKILMKITLKGFWRTNLTIRRIFELEWEIYRTSLPNVARPSRFESVKLCII